MMIMRKRNVQENECNQQAMMYPIIWAHKIAQL